LQHLDLELRVGHLASLPAYRHHPTRLSGGNW
jgi:hypothetical protein